MEEGEGEMVGVYLSPSQAGPELRRVFSDDSMLGEERMPQKMEEESVLLVLGDEGEIVKANGKRKRVNKRRREQDVGGGAALSPSGRKRRRKGTKYKDKDQTNHNNEQISSTPDHVQPQETPHPQPLLPQEHDRIHLQQQQLHLQQQQNHQLQQLEQLHQQLQLQLEDPHHDNPALEKGEQQDVVPHRSRSRENVFAIPPSFLSEPQRLPSGILSLLNGLLHDDEYEKSAQLLATMAELQCLPPDSVYSTLFESIKRASKRRESQTIVSTLMHIQKAFPPSTCPLGWELVHSPPLKSDWELIYGLLLGTADLMQERYGAEKRTKQGSRKKEKAKRFSDEWKEQDEEGVHLFNHKLLLQFFVEALQDDIRAQRRKSDTMIYRLLQMEIQPPVMIADPGADAEDHKSTYESSNPLEILMNVAFRILRVADMDLLLLIQDFLGQIATVYFTLSVPYDTDTMDLISNMRGGVASFEFSRKLSFLNTMKHHGAKMALICMILEHNYSQEDSRDTKLASEPLSIRKIARYYMHFTTKEAKGYVKGKRVVHKQNTLDRFVRHPQELLVILLSMLLQGVIGRGVHHFTERSEATTTTTGRHRHPYHKGENGVGHGEREKEKEKEKEEEDEERGFADDGDGEDDDWKNNALARRLNEKIKKELHDEILVDELAAVVGEFCERTREALHFDSKEFTANMLVLDKIKLLIECKRAEPISSLD